MKSSCFVANASPLGRWDAMGPKTAQEIEPPQLYYIALGLTHLRTSERPFVFVRLLS